MFISPSNPSRERLVTFIFLYTSIYYAEVEDIIRSEGAVPATIAIIHGKAYVGLSPQQMESIGTGGPAGGNSVVVKASTRDLPHVLNNRLS
eukprot:gene24620-29747_t